MIRWFVKRFLAIFDVSHPNTLAEQSRNRESEDARAMHNMTQEWIK